MNEVVHINELIKKDFIYTNENLNNADEVFKFIAEKAFENGRSTDKSLTYDGLCQREDMMSTGLMDGIAIPHTKNESIVEPTVMLIKNNIDLDWESLDDKKIKIIFTILVPDKEGDNTHLRILSKLSRKLMDDDFKGDIINNEEPENLLKIINKALEE